MSNATNRWLDKLAEADRAKDGSGSDYKISQLLKTDRQQISRYRRELDQMGEDMCIRLADALTALGQRTLAISVIAEVNAERAPTERVRFFWIRMGGSKKRRLGQKAKAIILIAGAAAAGMGFPSENARASMKSSADSLYIMSNSASG